MIIRHPLRTRLLLPALLLLLGLAGCAPEQAPAPEPALQAPTLSDQVSPEEQASLSQMPSLSVETVTWTRLSPTEIQLDWTPPSEGPAASYVVRRRPAGAEEQAWTRVAEISPEEPLSVIDRLEDAAPRQYVYTVEALPQDPSAFLPGESRPIPASTLLICLDPGHYAGVNTYQPGQEDWYDEGIINLRLAQALETELRDRYGIAVCMTRTGDSITLGGCTDADLDRAHLDWRGRFAGETGSTLFLSLHTNANRNNANGSPTWLQPIAINKPILIANDPARTSSMALRAANSIGSELAAVSFRAGLATVETFRPGMPGRLPVWTLAYNDRPDVRGGLFCRYLLDGRDYYGVLRGAAEAGVPGLIIEHGMHTVPEVRQALIQGDLVLQWAQADARGLANAFDFLPYP